MSLARVHCHTPTGSGFALSPQWGDSPSNKAVCHRHSRECHHTGLIDPQGQSRNGVRPAFESSILALRNLRPLASLQVGVIRLVRQRNREIGTGPCRASRRITGTPWAWVEIAGQIQPDNLSQSALDDGIQRRGRPMAQSKCRNRVRQIDTRMASPRALRPDVKQTNQQDITRM